MTGNEETNDLTPLDTTLVQLPVATAAPAPATAKRPSDFVNVRLSAAGLLFAGKDGTVHVSNAHMAYHFTGTTSQRVLRRGEWTLILSAESFNGSPIFELVADASGNPV